MEDSSSYGGGQGSGAGGFRRPRFGGPRPFRPSPVRVGEEYDVKIESLSKRGDSGVARVQGLVIFVVGTKVGDSVRIKITKVGRGYATAEVVGGIASSSVAEAPEAADTGSGSSQSPTEQS